MCLLEYSDNYMHIIAGLFQYARGGHTWVQIMRLDKTIHCECH